MEIGGSPDSHPQKAQWYVGSPSPGVQPEDDRIVRRVAGKGVQPEADLIVHRGAREPHGSRPKTHTDASVHADWAMDATVAQQNLAKWLRSSLGGVSNESFTAHEQEELLQHIAALRDEITRLTSLNDEQSKAVLGMLDQAQKDSKRLRRKDWLLAGIGAGTALVVTGAVPPLFMLHLAVRVLHVLGGWLTS